MTGIESAASASPPAGSLVLTNRTLFILALAGFGVSVYLTLGHYKALEVACTAIRGCEEVANHRTARGFGIPFLQAIPTAAFGAFMYAVLAALSLYRVAAASPESARKASSLQWLLSLGGVAVSAWLTYLEAYVIKAWCQWCVASAVIILLFFSVATLERYLAYNSRT